MLESIERRVQRALLDFQSAGGNLLNAQQNAVTVQGTERDGLEDEQIERALQKIQPGGQCFS